MPKGIKCLFDFLDMQAAELGITDSEVLHSWKTNRCAGREGLLGCCHVQGVATTASTFLILTWIPRMRIIPRDVPSDGD